MTEPFPPPHFAFNLTALASGQAAWTPFYAGVDICRLYGDGQAGPSAALLRYAPNAEVPLHDHGGYEHIFVLAGSQEDERGVYGEGMMVVNPPGTRHRVRSPKGCTVLVMWERPVTVVQGA